MSVSTSHRSASKTYQVPERFGAGGMLAMMFVFSLLFGSLRFMDAHGGYYLFFAVLGLVVGVSQMSGGKSPRRASIIAGAVLLPPSLFLTMAAGRGTAEAFLYWPMYLVSTPFGAAVGYLAGTLLGGAFLIADYLERFLDPRVNREQPLPTTDLVLAEDITELRTSQQQWLNDPPEEGTDSLEIDR